MAALARVPQAFSIRSARSTLEANGTLSRTEAIALASTNIETLLGMDVEYDLVAYVGGDMFDFSSRVAAVISPHRGFVDIL